MSEEPEIHTRAAPEVPALFVEQLALGELDADAAAQLRARLDARAPLPAETQTETASGSEAALAQLEASDREILADYPPAAMAARIRARAEAQREQRSGRWRPYVFAPTLVAAAAVVWVVVRDPSGEVVGPQPDRVEERAGPELTRIKGGVEPHVVVDRRTSAGHERLGPDEAVRAGDLLQISYVAAGYSHGVILSIDGAGAVTLHHPEIEGDEPALAEGEEVPLAHAYELDDAPGYERFFFVTREDGEMPRVSEVLRAAEQLAAQPLSARTAELPLAQTSWTQQSLLLRKGGAGNANETNPQPTPAQEEQP